MVDVVIPRSNLGRHNSRLCLMLSAIQAVSFYCMYSMVTIPVIFECEPVQHIVSLCATQN